MTYDVLIIGGGLAGAAAAIELAAVGCAVLVVERHRYPRHKMCGEFLSPETVAIFERLGVSEAIAGLAPARISAARVTAPDGRRLDVELPAPALGLSRYRLDALLLARARAVGATVWEGCAARGVRGSLEEGFEVETQRGMVGARVVLGAWGKRSTLDRTLARPFFGGRAGFLALKAHMRGPEPGARTELHGFAGGYCGLNRVEGGVVNVCLLATDEAWARAGKQVDPFWAMIQQENQALGEQLQGAERVSESIVISNISFARKAPVERDVLMLGDSAELISPLAGNGQAMALHAAALAVPLVRRFLNGEMDAARMRAGYARVWRGAFRERLLLGRVLQPLFLAPRALSAGLRVAAALPPMATWLVAGTRERR